MWRLEAEKKLHSVNELFACDHTWARGRWGMLLPICGHLKIEGRGRRKTVTLCDRVGGKNKASRSGTV